MLEEYTKKKMEHGLSGAMLQEVETPLKQSTKDVLAYCEKLPLLNGVAKKSAFNPMKIPKHLSTIYLLDVLDGGDDFVLRLIGSDIYQYVGSDVTGVKYSDHPEAEWRIKIAQLAMKAAKPIVVHNYIGDKDMLYTLMEAVYMPLVNDAGDIAFIFVYFTPMEGTLETYYAQHGL